MAALKHARELSTGGVAEQKLAELHAEVTKWQTTNDRMQQLLSQQRCMLLILAHRDHDRMENWSTQRRLGEFEGSHRRQLAQFDQLLKMIGVCAIIACIRFLTPVS